MIGYLKGTVHAKQVDNVLLLVQGVGYLVFVTPTVLSNLQNGTPAELYTHTLVREENLDLYGFKTPQELAFFKLLLNVSGIGAKTAMLVVDRGVSDVHKAIIQADVDFFTTIPRLGRKNAQKVIIELKNKVGSITELDLVGDASTTELVEALTAMGYSRQELAKAIKQIPAEAVTIEAKIRAALKALGK